MASHSRQEPGIGAAFRYLADQHLENPGEINEAAVKNHFTSVTQSAEWGRIGEQFARMFNNPPPHEDTKAIPALVGAMGFDNAVKSLASPSGEDSHTVHDQYEQIERTRQRAYEPVAALIDASEWASKDKATFYEDAYRVADMIHALHVSDKYAEEVSAVEAQKMSPTEMHLYQSAVPIGEPSDMVGISFGKTGQSARRTARRWLGSGKNAVTKNFGATSSAQQAIVVLRNKNTLTAKVYLDKGQIRQLIFSNKTQGGKQERQSTAADEGTNAYQLDEKVKQEFGIYAFYFEKDQITPFLPRDVQKMSISGLFSTVSSSSVHTTLGFKSAEDAFSSLGYFEDYLSEYPLGQACIWKLDGAMVAERSAESEQKTIRVPSGAPLTCTLSVRNAFGHIVYAFSASTNKFQVSQKIGDGLTDSQKIYQLAAKNKASDLHKMASPMNKSWKDENVRVFKFDMDKTKPVGGPSMLGEAGDFKTITPRCLLFCEYMANVPQDRSARKTQDIIRPLYAMLMIPTITRVNHKERRLASK